MHTCKDLSVYYHSGKDVFQWQPKCSLLQNQRKKKLNQHPAINSTITAIVRAHHSPLFHLFLCQLLGFLSRAVFKEKALIDLFFFLEEFLSALIKPGGQTDRQADRQSWLAWAHSWSLISSMNSSLAPRLSLIMSEVQHVMWIHQNLESSSGGGTGINFTARQASLTKRIKIGIRNL